MGLKKIYKDKISDLEIQVDRLENKVKTLENLLEEAGIIQTYFTYSTEAVYIGMENKVKDTQNLLKRLIIFLGLEDKYTPPTQEIIKKS